MRIGGSLCAHTIATVLSKPKNSSGFRESVEFIFKDLVMKSFANTPLEVEIIPSSVLEQAKEVLWRFWEMFGKRLGGFMVRLK